MAGIYRVNSAQWLTVTTPTDRQLSGVSSQRPNQLLNNPLCANPRPSCWINPAAFSLPAYGTISAMGRNNVPGPGFFQVDLSLSRDFKVKEAQRVEARLEAFNISNSFRAGVANLGATSFTGGSGVGTVFGTPTFGTITSALDPRILQFSVKYVF